MSFTLSHYLERGGDTAAIMAHARLLVRLGRRFEGVVPGGLARSARVANVKDGMVVIHADNSAVAAKLRQLERRLCGELSLGGLLCQGIVVKVQPAPKDKVLPVGQQKPLSGQACATLGKTAQELPPGRLRQALEVLLARSAKQP